MYIFLVYKLAKGPTHSLHSCVLHSWILLEVFHLFSGSSHSSRLAVLSLMYCTKTGGVILGCLGS
jgi:hypothetical protein